MNWVSLKLKLTSRSSKTFYIDLNLSGKLHFHFTFIFYFSSAISAYEKFIQTRPNLITWKNQFQ